MSKQRFLGGLLGASPVRDGSFTDGSSSVAFGKWDQTASWSGATFTGDYRVDHATGSSTTYRTSVIDAVLGPTDKVYIEVTANSLACYFGLCVDGSVPTTSYLGSNSTSWAHQNGDRWYHNAGSVGTRTQYSISSSNVLMYAIDRNTGHMWAGLNGTWHRDPLTQTGNLTGITTTGDMRFGYSNNSTRYSVINTGDNVNFNGQFSTPATIYSDEDGNGEFRYEVPTGFKALATITNTTTDRTTSNLGILSLDEAGPETNEGTAVAGDANWDDVSLLIRGNTIADSSGNSLLVTADGATANAAQTKFGNGSMSFDGVDDTVGVANSTALDLSSGDFTIECWCYHSGQMPPNVGLFGKRATGGSYGPFTVTGENNTDATKALRFFGDTGSGGSPWAIGITGTTDFPINQWVHFAVTRSGNVYTMWQNGASIGTTTVSGSLMTNSDQVTLGLDSTTGATNYWDGYIEDFRITKGVARDIAADWTAGVYNSALEGAPVAGKQLTQLNWGGIRGRDVLTAGTAASGDANWSGVELLLDFEGQSVTDHSGNATNLSVGNGSNTSGGTAVFGSGTNAKNGSYSFNSSGTGTANPYIALTDPALGTGEFTLECWLKVSSASSYANLMTNEQQGSSPGYGFSWQLKGTSGGMLLWNQWANKITGTTNVVDGNWHHVAITRNSANEVTLWVDGQKDHTNTVTDSGSYSITNSGTNPFLIGHNLFHANRHVAGYIDDVRITKGVCRYNDTANGFTPPSALPQGAAVAASDPSLANTGILSLSELLQASYGPTGLSADILVVGGGAGGSETSSGVSMGNGGSGGAVTLASAYDLGTSAITISVGAGGTAAQDSGYDDDGGAGGQSAFGAITASGAPLNTRGVTAQQTSFTTYGGSTTNYTTSETGSGVQGASPYDGLNGAGAGGNASSTAGGDGYLWSVTNARYGAGGGAYKFGGASGYSGGSGGGATGGYGTYTSATTATGYGSGGGGGYLTGYPSSGTSGAVLVYLSGTTYTLAEAQAAFTGAGGDVAVSTPAGGGTLITFTGNGDWTPPAA